MADYVPPDFSKLDRFSMARAYSQLRLKQAAALQNADTETAQTSREAAEQLMKSYSKKWKSLMEPDLNAPESMEIFKKVANSINASEKITDLKDPRYVDPKQVLKKAYGSSMMNWDNAQQAIPTHPLEEKVAAVLKPYLPFIPMGPEITRK